MTVIAHAGDWALGLLQATPLIVIAAFGIWRSRDERRRIARTPVAESP